PPPHRLGRSLGLHQRRLRSLTVSRGDRTLAPHSEQFARLAEPVVVGQTLADTFQPDRRIGFLFAFSSVRPFSRLPAIEPHVGPFLPFGEVTYPFFELLDLLFRERVNRGNRHHLNNLEREWTTRQTLFGSGLRGRHRCDDEQPAQADCRYPAVPLRTRRLSPEKYVRHDRTARQLQARIFGGHVAATERRRNGWLGPHPATRRVDDKVCRHTCQQPTGASQLNEHSETESAIG